MSLYNNFQKGEFKSEFIQDGFASLVNCDVHTKIGTLKSQLALIVDSATPNENSILVNVPSGIIYAVSKASGKIWERAVAGTWTLKLTDINGAHVGAGYFNGRLWYWTATKLGYLQITSVVTTTIADPGVVTLASHGLAAGDPVTFSTTGALPTGITAGTTYYARPDVSLTEVNEFWLYDTSAHAVTGGATGRIATTGTQSGVHNMGVHTFATFTNSGSVKPFLEGGVNRAFAYIGDGAQIARVDKDNIFSANVLEIPLGETITDIAEWGDDVVLTAIGARTKIYRWDQVSDSYYKPDLISYKDIDMLIQSQNSNIIYALCRTKDDFAEFMYYTGQELAEIPERRISDTTASDSFMKTEFDGRIHFAVGTKIYTMRNNALVCEYTAVATVASLCTDGDNLFVSCGATGVYKIGTSRATGLVVTPVFEGLATQAIVNYDLMPTGTSLTARVKINDGSWTAITLVKEEEKCRYVMREGFPSKNIIFLQLEITLVGSTTLTPIIRSIEIL